MNETTIIKMLVHLAEREQKLRKAVEQLSEAGERLVRWHQSRKAREDLFHKLDGLEARIAPKPTGRPATWKGPIGERTIRLVEAMRRRGHSTIHALRVLRKRQPWAYWWEDHSEAAIQSHYQDALAYWGPIYNEIAEIEAAADEVYRPFED